MVRSVLSLRACVCVKQKHSPPAPLRLTSFAQCLGNFCFRLLASVTKYGDFASFCEENELSCTFHYTLDLPVQYGLTFVCNSMCITRSFGPSSIRLDEIVSVPTTTIVLVGLAPSAAC